jgi:pimeloyl-ACP methyl ester carboxylesterase
MSPAGVFDMAGNAKEWCWNEAGVGRRFILGGAWDEPEYMFAFPAAVTPFDRSPTNGFRCIKRLSTEPLAKGVDAPVPPPSRDFASEQPVSDEVFRIYRSLYSYDKTDLNARLEAADDSDPRWRKERVSYNAAYGAERIPALVFLPKKLPPPYQTLVCFPTSTSIQTPSIEPVSEQTADLIAAMVASGRAVVWPIYKGTYERRDELKTYVPEPTSFHRDHVIQWSKDLGRSIDYLETRADIRSDKLAYWGGSWGAAMGALLPALEPRFKASVLGAGGFFIQMALPEVDQVNFAPRITIPTLMVNGRYDVIFPVETSQRPMYRSLGTAPEHKRHIIYETGHSPPVREFLKEVLAWLDKYLGPVK